MLAVSDRDDAPAFASGACVVAAAGDHRHEAMDGHHCGWDNHAFVMMTMLGLRKRNDDTAAAEEEEDEYRCDDDDADEQ